MPQPQSRRYTDQFGREIHVPHMEDPRKQHLTAKHMARSLLTPPQLADYQAGRFQLYVVDDLGRKHWMLYGAKGRLGVKPPS